MRTNYIPSLDRSASVFGFGCASLGSRVSERAALIALERAYDQGVSWFDVAPPYGDGNAERILGKFLRGKRDKVVVATKVGIAPPAQGGALSYLKPAIRAAIKWAPGVRSLIVRGRPKPIKMVLTPELIEDSVTKSLSSLQVDHVDVIALHEPPIDYVGHNEIFDACSRLIDKGYARAISVAGSLEEDLAFIEASAIFSIAQMPNDPFTRNVEQFPKRLSSRLTTVTHGVFGVDGAHAKLTKQLKDDSDKLRLFQAAGFSGRPEQASRSFLLQFSLESNPDGICLLSMNKQDHLAAASAAAREQSVVAKKLADSVFPARCGVPE